MVTEDYFQSGPCSRGHRPTLARTSPRAYPGRPKHPIWSGSSAGGVRDCRRCERTLHWIEGVGPEPGHLAHAEPAPPEHEPSL
jgi:hypothetical protein